MARRPIRAKSFKGRILDLVTINVSTSYSALPPGVIGLTQSTGVASFTYDRIRAALGDDATTAADLAGALPVTDPITGAYT